MQSMKNAIQQRNPAWPRRCADKLSAAMALRPSKNSGGGAQEILGGAARTGQRSRPTFIVGHIVTTIIIIL